MAGYSSIISWMGRFVCMQHIKLRLQYHCNTMQQHTATPMNTNATLESFSALFASRKWYKGRQSPLKFRGRAGEVRKISRVCLACIYMSAAGISVNTEPNRRVILSSIKVLGICSGHETVESKHPIFPGGDVPHYSKIIP